MALESKDVAGGDQTKQPSLPEHHGLDHCVHHCSPPEEVVTLSFQPSGPRLLLTLWPTFISRHHNGGIDRRLMRQVHRLEPPKPSARCHVRDRKCSTCGAPRSGIKTTPSILSAQSLPSVWSSRFQKLWLACTFAQLSSETRSMQVSDQNVSRPQQEPRLAGRLRAVVV